MSIDLKLSATHDLQISDNKLVLVDGAAQKAQQIKIALLTFLGEWQFDNTVGVPYLEQVLVKNHDKFKVEAVLRKKILAVNGVIRILSFSMDVDRQHRALHLYFSVLTNEGKISDKIIINRGHNV